MKQQYRENKRGREADIDEGGREEGMRGTRGRKTR